MRTENELKKGIAESKRIGMTVNANSLIPQEDALILWNVCDNAIIDLIVTSHLKSISSRSDFNAKYPFSDGACYDFWRYLPVDDLLSSCIRILYTEAATSAEMRQHCLFQFSRIKEAEAFRHIYYRVYGNMDNQSYEEFLEKFY